MLESGVFIRDYGTRLEEIQSEDASKKKLKKDMLYSCISSLLKEVVEYD